MRWLAKGVSGREPGHAPYPHSIAVVAAAVASAFFFASACGGGSSTQPTPARSESAATVVQRVQTAMLQKSGYRVDVAGHNFVLPQWGGVDAGTVDIATSGATISGRLDRTGDGSYEMLLAGGRTYFKRTTCSHYTRVSGGGPDVLTPFLVATNGSLTKASGLSFTDAQLAHGWSIAGDFGDFGPGVIDVDATTYLPLTLTKRRDSASGAESIWRFSNWGNAPHVTSPTGEIGDNGPGGNPC